jgi:hypothetical protein
VRFAIRVDAIWKVPLLAGGATRDNSYVELTEKGVRFRFGLLFDRTIPYTDVKTVFPRSWPFYYGIGWRTNLRGVIGLVGSYHDVVEVRLKGRTGRAWGIFPMDRICVSVEEPERVISELEARLAAPPAHAGRGSRASSARKRTRRREGA